jgi:hypothetical protein
MSGSHNEGFLTSGAVYSGGLDSFISQYLGPYIGQ